MAEQELDPVVVDVWKSNVRQEFRQLSLALNGFPVIAIDTEFPGCLIKTPRHAPEVDRYRDMALNLMPTKPIQLGITLSDDSGNIYYKTWQFNFQFDVSHDVSSPESINFLRSNAGIDFEKLKSDGIEVVAFGAAFLRLLAFHRAHANAGLTWVTFHGLYDLGYTVQMLTNRCMPPNIPSFVNVLRVVLGDVLDVKYMAKFVDGLQGGELGLERLAAILGVERVGSAHQAGSDTLLTTMVYARMREVYPINERKFFGCLYGITPVVSKHSVRYCQPENHRVGRMFRNDRMILNY